METELATDWLLSNIPDLSKYISTGLAIELHAKFQEARKKEIENLNKMQIVNDVDCDGNIDFMFKPNK